MHGVACIVRAHGFCFAWQIRTCLSRKYAGASQGRLGLDAPFYYGPGVFIVMSTEYNSKRRRVRPWS